MDARSSAFLDAVRDATADRPAGRLEPQLVDVAPAPVFARLEGPDDRVLRAVEVGCRMLALRVVAAAHMPAGHAQPQVDPGTADLQAVLAAVGARGDLTDLVEVGAFGHRLPSAYDARRNRRQSG